MTTNFPTSLDNFVNPTPADELSTVTVLHTDQHSNTNDAIEAIEAKVGVNNSAVTTSLDYLVKNTASVDPGHKHSTSSINGLGTLATQNGTFSGTSSGTNTGDQTSIVGITGTKAQFDAACTDGNFLYVGDVTQYTDEMAQDAVGAMVDSTLVYVDSTPLLTRAALTGDVTAAQSSNVTTIANDAVTYAKIQNVTTARLLGRASGGSGDVEEITLGTNLSFAGTTLNAAGGGGGGNPTFTNVEKNLGSSPLRAGKFTITGLVGQTIGKPVIISQAVAPYTGKGTLADEAEMDAVTVCGSITAADTATCYWKSATFVKGNFKFDYLIGA